LYIVLFLAVLLSAPTTARSATAGNVHPNIELSLTERFRLVTWDNVISLDDGSSTGVSFTRHRTSAMGRWFPSERFEFALKLTNEFRNYFVPENSRLTAHELFVDQLYARANLNPRLPLTVTAGRQNMILGEGFVMMDGSPLDGSRSIYFNALRFDIELASQRTLTLFYSYQDYEDNALPIINSQDQPLIEQPEEGFGAYFTGQSDPLDLQVYFIRKNIKQRPGSSYQTSEINCLGARAKYPLLSQATATIEAAYQVGKFGDWDRKAFGGYWYLDYKTNWPDYLPQMITVGGVFLSGDDPSSEDWESWDPLFSRWPKWSESYIYTLIPEKGVAQWQNLASLWCRTDFTLSDDVTFRLDYHHLMSPQVCSNASYGGEGKTRGNLMIGKLMYVLNPCLTGHLLWEHFEPGSFYFDGADTYNWLRAELMLSVK
jgi:hypothetical protein